MYMAIRCANCAQYIVGYSVAIEFILSQHAETAVEVPAPAQFDVVAESLRLAGVGERRAKPGAGLDGQVVESRLPVLGILLITPIPVTPAVLSTLLRVVREHPRPLIQSLS